MSKFKNIPPYFLIKKVRPELNKTSLDMLNKPSFQRISYRKLFNQLYHLNAYLKIYNKFQFFETLVI